MFAKSLAALLSSVALAGAAELERERTVWGDRGCAEWNATHTGEPDYSDTVSLVKKIGAESWVLGYVSGVNSMAPGPDQLRDIKPNTIYAWMDRFCAKHPKSLLLEGTDSLLLELLKISRN
jgi:hypothetical protein